MELIIDIDPDKVLTLSDLERFVEVCKSFGVSSSEPLTVRHHYAGHDMGGDKKGSDWCTVRCSS